VRDSSVKMLSVLLDTLATSGTIGRNLLSDVVGMPSKTSTRRLYDN